MKPFSKKVYDPKLHKSVYLSETFANNMFNCGLYSSQEHPFGVYDIDLGIRYNGKPVALIEVENRKTAWKVGDFPFKTISLLERKYKYLDRADKYHVFYLGFRADMKDCYVFNSWVLRDLSIKKEIKHNKSGIGCEVKNEFRYEVPIKNAIFGISDSVSYIKGFIECGLKSDF